MIKGKGMATSAQHTVDEALGQLTSNLINQIKKEYLFSKRQFSK